MDAIHQSFHVGVSVGIFLRIKLPIADVVLPSVIERYPNESETFDSRQRVVKLLRHHGTAISPGAPDRSVSVVRGFGHREALLYHEAAILDQSAEVVSLMHCDESAESVKAFSWIERN